MRKKRTRLIGSKLRNLPKVSESANNLTMEIEATNPEQCPIQPNVEKSSTTIITSKLGNGDEQNLVSEIWKNRLNASVETPAPIISSNDSKSGTKIKLSPLINKKSTSFNGETSKKWSWVRKAKFYRQQSQRISIRGFKGTAILQNMKTAAMLFVVADVYIITLIPAMLMAIGVIPMYLPIFYMYYVNNAINPIIYCFMNPAFREDVQNFFTSQIRKWHKVHRER